MAPDAASPLGEGGNWTGGALPRSWIATLPDTDAGLPPVFAHATDGGASSLGATAGPSRPDGGSGGPLVGVMNPRMRPIAFLASSLMMGLAPGSFVRAQDELLLADQQGDSPRSMEAGAGEILLGRSGGSGDESMPMASPLISPRANRRTPPCLMGLRLGELVRSAGTVPRLTLPCPMGPEAEGDRRPRLRLLETRRMRRSELRGRNGKSRVTYRGPKERGPHGWASPIQQAIRNKATCRDCGYPFQGDKVRMSTLVKAWGNRSCYSHIECIPGGLHPLDTLEHLTLLSHEQLANIEKVRFTNAQLGPTLPFARPPRTVTEATAVYGPAWWTTRTWAGMRKLHGLTLVDVPEQVWGQVR